MSRVTERYRSTPGPVVSVETTDVRDLRDPRNDKRGCAIYAICPRCETLYVNVTAPVVLCPHLEGGKERRYKCHPVFAPVRKL